MPFKDPVKQAAWNNAYLRTQRQLNTPVAEKRRARNRKHLSERYHTDPEYRARAIRKAAERVRQMRARRKQEEAETLARAVEKAKELREKAGKLAENARYGIQGIMSKERR